MLLFNPTISVCKACCHCQAVEYISSLIAFFQHLFLGMLFLDSISSAVCSVHETSECMLLIAFYCNLLIATAKMV